MCDEIMPNLFRIQIPLPESPLKYLNSYVIRDEERNLIVDTGLNHKACLEAMQDGLRKLGVDLERSDIFITHLHADHFGLVSTLASESSLIFFSRPEKELIESWEGFGAMLDYAGKNGFPKDQLDAALSNHPGARYGTGWIPDLKVLGEGDPIIVGDYQFRCVETPGHTAGHLCLYEPTRKLLIAGDHILIDITPNIQCWSDSYNPLRHYLASLDKVFKMDIDLVLPGHRRLIEDHRARINELKEHHSNRLSEVLDILHVGSQQAFQIASQMTWDLTAKSWDDFPVAQKWFATGEAIAHLRYLEEEGKVSRHVEDESTVFSLSDR